MTSLTEAVRLLRSGRLVAFPTETVYGLGANALDEAAVRRIFEAKGRPLTSPLIVHVASIGMAQVLASKWPAEAQALAEKFWPGPLTIVVAKRETVPDLVTAGLPSVALRMPRHSMALALLEQAGIPLAAPSANRFTELSPTTAEHVHQSLGGRVDLILDGGPCEVGIESTVVSFAGETPAILRPGAISQTQIEAVIGKVEVRGGQESPGQHAKHYSPRTRVVLGPSPREGNGVRLELPHDPLACAERLYALLHEMDVRGCDWIAVDLPPDTPEWAGVRDRLLRAAGNARI